MNMKGVVYIACTSVGRHIINSHLKYHPSIPILGIINLDRKRAINKANYDSLFDLAYNNDIDIHYCENVNSKPVIDFIKERNPDLIIQSGWSQKFGSELLSIPKYGCIGEHPSPIPIGRGAACVNWAIIENKKEWGDSFFKMVEKYDAGQLIAQKHFLIEEYDNVATVYDKVAFSSYYIIKNKLHRWVSGIFDSLNIDETKATYYKRRHPKDGELSFSWDDMKIYNYVRALTKPYPGAYFYYENKKIFVWDAKLTNKISELQIGSLFVDPKNIGLALVTGNKKIITLIRLQIEGLPEFFGHEFYNKIHIVNDDNN